jgi:hypothetical protein
MGEIMGSTQVDTKPATDEAASLQPPEPHSPPAATYTPYSPARASVFVPRERRLWTAALAAALLVTAGGLGILYADDTGNQATVRSLTLANESLTGRNQNLQDALKVTHNQLTASQGQVDSLSTELKHPTLGVWNVPAQLHNPTEYLSSTVPDTFTYHLKLTSSGPMSVSILSTTQFRDALICVYNGRGNTNWCMNHSGAAYGVLSVTSVNYDFNLAEGCAAYLAVITAAGPVTITPNVSVTYNPASGPTGSCA